VIWEVEMAKQTRYVYECLYQTDLGWFGPDQRRERWIQKGRTLIQPQRVQHIIRCFPSKDRGLTSRGDPIPADYIITPRPLGKSYTEEVKKMVSRSLHDGTNPGMFGKRVMREKVNKVKFRLVPPDEVTESMVRYAFDYGDDWDPELFKDRTDDVNIQPKTELALATGGTV
jgi:hypothetical protein